MRGNSFIVACVAAAVWPSPFCAYRIRPPGFHVERSLEEWFAYLLSNADCHQALRISIATCAVFGFIAGVAVRQFLEPVTSRKKFELPFLRTPLFATILTPISIATVLLVVYYHTPKSFEGIEWQPVFYFDHLLFWSIVTAAGGAVCVGTVNILEYAFEESSFLARLGIVCCWPLAIGVGLIFMTGAIGAGLLAGVTIGQHYGYPIMGGWSGMCIAAIVLAIVDDVFWPVYFPMTRVSTQ